MAKKTLSLKNIFLIILAVVWIASFFLSTKIILKATGYHLNKQNSVLSKPTPEIMFHFDRVSEPKSLLRIIYFEGWAFHPNYKPDSKRHITVILNSKDYSYELPTETYSRSDVVNHFIEKYTLTANDLGFIGSFSIITIKDNDYELFIKIWEENGPTMVINTGKFYNKSGDSFKSISKPAALIPESTLGGLPFFYQLPDVKAKKEFVLLF